MRLVRPGWGGCSGGLDEASSAVFGWKYEYMYNNL
jgi:hypothetical protein